MTARKRRRASRWMDDLAAILWLAAITFVVLSGARVAMGALAQHSEARKTRWEPVIVRRGDCLWDLALRYRRQGEDPRRVVRAICEGSGISANRVLQPGDRLLVPVYHSPHSPDAAALAQY